MSRTDTLKIAQADVETISGHLSNARRGPTLLNRPLAEAKAAVLLLERTARQMRKAFRLEEPSA
jgi:hypothetical protein